MEIFQRAAASYGRRCGPCTHNSDISNLIWNGHKVAAANCHGLAGKYSALWAAQVPAPMGDCCACSCAKRTLKRHVGATSVVVVTCLLGQPNPFSSHNIARKSGYRMCFFGCLFHSLYPLNFFLFLSLGQVALGSPTEALVQPLPLGRDAGCAWPAPL